jgi:FkbM family methyltransferase
MKRFIKFISELNSEFADLKLEKAIQEKKKIIVLIPDNIKMAQRGFKILQQWGVDLYTICIPDEIIECEHTNYENIIRLSQLKNEQNIVIIVFNFLALPIQWTMISYLKNLGIENIIMVGEDTHYNYNLIMKHLVEIYEVYEMLDTEDGSKKIYLSLLKRRVTGDVTDIIFSENKQYFLNQYRLQPGNVIIDAGAYDGTTSIDLLNSIHGNGQVYSFELDKYNYEKFLKDYTGVYKNNIVFENLGLSDSEGEVFYVPATTGTKYSSMGGTEKGKVIDIDSYIAKKRITSVNYIKMDIEGAELEALHGARNVISTYHPQMAISLYHRPDDLWTIPIYIKQLNPQYHFSVAHHFIDVRHGYTPQGFTESEELLQKCYGEAKIYHTIWESVLYVKG